MNSQTRRITVFAIAAGFMLIACNLNTVMPPPATIISPPVLTSDPAILIVSPTAMPPADTQVPPAPPLPEVIPPAATIPAATPIPTEPPPTDTIPDDPSVTVIDGASLGVTYNFQWQLSATGDAPVEQWHTFRVTGLVPPSPSSSSRSLFLIMTCEGSGFESFRWGMASQGRPTLGCGDNQSGFVSLGAEVFTIVAVALPGAPVELTYSVQIHLGNPY